MFSRKLKVAFRILLVLVLLIAFGVIGVYFGYNYVLSQEARLDTLKENIASGDFYIDEDTEGAVPLVIETGDMTSDIADKLYESGLIDNKLVFSLMSKVNGFDGTYLAGTHYLTPGLNYDEIMYVLTLEPESVVVTFPEGITYEEIKARLHEAGLTFNDEEFDNCMDSPNLFTDYRFVAQLDLSEERDHVLSGYLFPDTYEFDVNASPYSIINTFLANTNSKLYDEYYTRAEALGMSLDEVITLASVIQTETGNALDMMYVSAVFHNRMNSEDEGMRYLASDATINFIRQLNGLKPHLALSAYDLELDSPYNTYTHPGLPPGPICMPGLDAIQAALYPEPNCNYYYFCASADGGTAFAVTREEHEANVAQYMAAWEEADRQTEEGISSEPSEPPAPSETSEGEA
ncbi:MAG: endolytic transglycosylase MltG [Clostridiales bacterium]|nr:endolytic transglycosylase MltG [Clostridiales bacterium]